MVSLPSALKGPFGIAATPADRTLLYLAFTIFHRLVQAAGEQGDLDDASPRGV